MNHVHIGLPVKSIRDMAEISADSDANNIRQMFLPTHYQNLDEIGYTLNYSFRFIRIKRP